MLSFENIKRYAAEAGFALCGIARARALDEHREWYAAGLAASGSDVLGYLERGWERRLDPSCLLPGAKTVIVCALTYLRTGYPIDFTGQKTAAFALQDEDYHVRVKRMLGEILERLKSDYQRFNTHKSDRQAELRGKICCDTSAILEKAWAAEAGLGFIGRNSLLINPIYGSFLSLGEIILDAECDRYDEPLRGVSCGECERCVATCPVGALVGREFSEPRPEVSAGSSSEPAELFSGCPERHKTPEQQAIMAVDTGHCISARTVEKARKDIKVEPIHGWIYGCDECQNCCPYNRRRQ
jgi:epoxyqueuosine reductase